MARFRVAESRLGAAALFAAPFLDVPLVIDDDDEDDDLTIDFPDDDKVGPGGTTSVFFFLPKSPILLRYGLKMCIAQGINRIDTQKGS